MRWIIEQKKVFVLQPGYPCKKSSELVIYVLCYNHPDAHSSTKVSLDSYPGRPPELVPFDENKDTVA